MSLWQEVCSKEKLYQSWNTIYKNSSCCGIDKISPKKFSENSKKNLDDVFEQLQCDNYELLPVLKINGKKRPLVIPTVKDRIVMKSITNLFTDIFETQFCKSSYAYRPHISTLNAIKDIEKAIKNNYKFFYRTDIKKFFESINHDILIKQLSDSINDEKVILFIKKFLKSKVYDNKYFIQNISGIHQGSPISPLLSNVYLNSFDHLIQDNNIKIFRYSDDILILSKKEIDILNAKNFIKNELKYLDLDVNIEKESEGEIKEGFDFLGYYFNDKGKNASLKSLEALDSKIKVIFSEQNPSIEKSKQVLTGWENYFGKLETSKISSLETLLTILKTGSYKEIKDIIDTRKKFKNFSESHIHLDLAKEWKKVYKLDCLNYEVFCFINKVNLNEEGQVNSLAEVLNIEFKTLKDIIVYFQKNNYDLSFFIQGLVDYGHYGLAKEFHQLQNNISSEKIEIYGLENIDDNFFNIYIDLFSSGLSYYNIETKDFNEKRIFTKILKKIKKEIIESHLSGEITIASPIFSNTNKVKNLIFDIDISRELLNNNENYDKNLKKALFETLKISKELSDLGLKNLIAFSGSKGYHIWIFFDEEIEATKVRKFAFNVLKKVGSSEIGINREVFPNKDKLDYDEESCRIKLPLGFHVLSRKQCFFIDDKGNTYTNQVKVLSDIKKITNSEFEQAFYTLDSEEKLFIQEKRIEINETDLTKFPECQKILKGCEVIRSVVKKAEDTGYINHKERMLLLSTLGHVENEGKLFLHEVMKKCFNYDKYITDKYINKISENPIGCKRIKEAYQEISCNYKCNCYFSNTYNLKYPSPVLYAQKNESLKKTEVDNLLSKKEIKNNVQIYIKKLIELKKQIKGVQNSMDLCEIELNKYFDELKVNELEIDSGVLIRDSINNVTKWRIEI